MRVLRVLMFFLRIIFGVVFILSGFFKLTDPVGTALIVEEYFSALHLDFIQFSSLYVGMLVATVEFLTGIAIFMCVRMKAASYSGLIMMVFFTVLTFFMAYFDAIDECGCFGQAIHLTLWQTFYKNLVLLACVIPIFLFRKKFKPVAPVPAEWAFLGTYGLLALFCSVYSYIQVPLIEFGDFKVGSNLSLKHDLVTDNNNFETVFLYEKDGEQKYFGIKEIPDTSWRYVASDVRYLGNDSDLLFDMTLSNGEGDIMTDAIIDATSPVYLFVATDPQKIRESYWPKVAECMDSIAFRGGEAYVLAPDRNLVADSVLNRYPVLESALLYGDRKTLVSIVRSNGGVVLIHNGVVVKKWAGWRFGTAQVQKMSEEDSEEVTAKGTISQRLFYESSILVLFLIIIVFRYVCGIIYGKRSKDA